MYVIAVLQSSFLQQFRFQGFRLLSEFEKIQNEIGAQTCYITRLDIFDTSNQINSKSIFFLITRQLRPVNRVWKSVNDLRIIKQIGIIDRVA